MVKNGIRMQTIKLMIKGEEEDSLRNQGGA